MTLYGLSKVALDEQKPNDPNAYQRSFRKLIVGESISSFGTQLSLIAVPTYAVIYLNASATQLGAVNIMQYGPPLLLGVFAGKLADRLDRKRTMVIADLFAATVSLYLAYLMWTENASMIALYVLIFAIAISGTFYAIGSAALVPQLLLESARGRGNAHLAAGRAISDGIAHVVAARLITVAAGALVVLLDALTYLVRALLVRSIVSTQDEKQHSAVDQLTTPIDSSVKSTWVIMLQNPVLLQLIGAQGTLNIGGAFILAFFYIYAYNVLELEPFHIGLMLAVGKLSGFLSALILPVFLTNDNLKLLSLLALTASSIVIWLIVAAQWAYAFPILLLYECLFSFSATIFTITATTLRQNLTPMDQQGRVASFMVMFGYACLIFGSFLAAATASFISIETGVVVGCILSSATVFWFAAPSIKRAVARFLLE